jgi:hypothetical protein
MSYFVNKTDGSVIVVLDGTKDTTSTSLVLFGRLTTNYGDQTNENFVRLLENFSNSTSPANPISGQLWFDRNSNNLKVYTTDNIWVTVGSVIEGNVDISGNLVVGPNNFAIKDLDGNVQITNPKISGNISVFGNVGGVSTRVLHINSLTGLVEVNANATSNFGVTTKLYVDSELQRATSSGDTNLLANVGIINANLAARVGEENALRANITAANAQIALRDTIARVNSINTAIDVALTANVNAIYSNLAVRVNQTSSVETAMIANVAAANARVNGANVNITAVNNRLDSVNTAIDAALTANLATKADLISPTFSGTPETPTAAVNTLSSQIASTAFVMNTLGANILPRIAAVNTSMIANVAAANVYTDGAYSAIAALDLGVTNQLVLFNNDVSANLALKANLISPALTGTPTAPTAAFGANTGQIATTAYVMTRAAYWDGSRKFVSTGNPTVSDGSNGDIWFKYNP